MGGGRGGSAGRGGILDVFPPTTEPPLRVEFFGDEVEEVRTFSVADQRSLGVSGEVSAGLSGRVVLLTPEVKAAAAELLTHQFGGRVRVARLALGLPVLGMEALAPVLVEDL